MNLWSNVRSVVIGVARQIIVGTTEGVIALTIQDSEWVRRPHSEDEEALLALLARVCPSYDVSVRRVARDLADTEHLDRETWVKSIKPPSLPQIGEGGRFPTPGEIREREDAWADLPNEAESQLPLLGMIVAVVALIALIFSSLYSPAVERQIGGNVRAPNADVHDWLVARSEVCGESLGRPVAVISARLCIRL